jgi:hypothetical protein
MLPKLWPLSDHLRQLVRLLIELNGLILAAQNSALTTSLDQAQLLERINTLEKQVASFETWETEKQRYELADYGEGTYAYRVKETMQNGEPAHRLCAGCFQKNQKSILQNVGGFYSGREKFWCPSCNSKYFFGQFKRPQLEQPRAIRSGRSWME